MCIYAPIPQRVYIYLYLYLHFPKTDLGPWRRVGSTLRRRSLRLFVSVQRFGMKNQECLALLYGRLCVLQCVGVCCRCVASVLQACCSVVQCGAERSALWYEELGVVCPALWYTLCVAVYCSVLECVTVRCSVLQVCGKCVASVLQCVQRFGTRSQGSLSCFTVHVVCCSVLQCKLHCAVVCCSVLQRVACVLQPVASVLQLWCKYIAVCSVLWHEQSGVFCLALWCTLCVAVCCSVLQCTTVC